MPAAIIDLPFMNSVSRMRDAVNRNVEIPAGDAWLEGELVIPANATGIVIFAHGSGSSRHSPRNQSIARVLHESGIGTLLFDLLTREEERSDNVSREHRFDIKMLATRLEEAALWLRRECGPERPLPLAFFGASTGAAAALVAAASLGSGIKAVVSRGGRPDLAGDALPRVKCPTLLIVGSYDELVLALNDEAFSELCCEKDFRIVPGASHLFEEPGKLDQVAALSTEWFLRHFPSDDESDLACDDAV